MRAFDFSILSVLAFPAIVHAVPPSPIIAACNEIRQNLGYSASAVCSSYLGPIPAKAVTVTSTVTATAIATATIVHTNQQTTALPAPTQSTTVQVTSTVVVTSEVTRYSDDPIQTQQQTVTGEASTVYVYDGPQKRNVLNPILCGAERKYSKPIVTAACRSICKPSTRTITITQTATATARFTVTQTQEATQIVTKDPVSTVIVTNTQYVFVTQQVDLTTTLGPTNTDTVVITTTVTPIVNRPAICNAQGLPGARAYNYNANFNTDQSACIAGCKSDSRCLATGFYLVRNPTTGETTGTCRRYDKPVADSADLGFGYYNFNDKACPAGN